ncbi:MAG TPA: hypothetical protein VGR06_38180 [Actinophytocola sp.]|uniref:hypothetical protein n=1 Tax=Actinophytocola sp. TaxID=1872138 RepID=UPI002DFE0FFB|nr:hypothetical protein [Actinophytocola sp.]
MTRWRAGLGLLTLVLAVSGCGRTVSPGAAGQASTFPVRPGPLTTQAGLPAPGAAGRFPAEPGPPVWVDAACPPEVSNADPLSQANRGRLPDEFVTAWVLRCRTEIRYVPGQGKQAFRVTERADTPAAEMVSQLRLPAEPPTAGGCLAYGVSVPYFALVDAGGRALLPAVPLDECLRPRREALQELDKLPFTRLSETPAGQVQSQESIDTGCPEAYQDMIIISADRAKPAPADRSGPDRRPRYGCVSTIRCPARTCRAAGCAPRARSTPVSPRNSLPHWTRRAPLPRVRCRTTGLPWSRRPAPTAGPWPSWTAATGCSGRTAPSASSTTGSSGCWVKAYATATHTYADAEPYADAEHGYANARPGEALFGLARLPIGQLTVRGAWRS